MAILLTTPVLQRVIDGAATLADAVSSGDASAAGDVEAAAQIFGHLDTFMSNFPLVEP